MDSETFHNVASGIQSLVFAIGAVIGGIWAIYKFGSLKELDKAKVELEEIRKRLRERGILDVKIHPELIGRDEKSFYYVLVNVGIHNTGNRTEVINWSKSGVYATKVNADTDARFVFDQTCSAQYLILGEAVPASSILPDQKRDIPFLFPLRCPGMYQLLFRASVSSLEESIHAQEYTAAGVEAEEYVWQTSTYFNVSEIDHPKVT